MDVIKKLLRGMVKRVEKAAKDAGKEERIHKKKEERARRKEKQLAASHLKSQNFGINGLNEKWANESAGF